MANDLIHYAVSQHAVVCIAQNKLAEAAALYAWLVERHPADMQSRVALAFALVGLDRPEEAAGALPSMEHLAMPAVQYVMGRIYATRGDPRAVAAFERFLALRDSASMSSTVHGSAVARPAASHRATP